MLHVLTGDAPFPPVTQALTDPNGLLAVGGDLSVARLQAAYTQGIFPWFSHGQPLLWWSPDPRMVLPTAGFRPPHALAKKLRQIARAEQVDAPARIEVRMNTACAQVMAGCAAPRNGQPGTWIVPAMQAAYLQWHRAGGVHSIETWIDGQLAGGLYGIALGGMFFGESMFTRVTDASKIALSHLVAFLARHDVPLIDCQQDTAHLASLGGHTMPRARFSAHLESAITRPALPWAHARLLSDGTLLPLPAGI